MKNNGNMLSSAQQNTEYSLQTREKSLWKTLGGCAHSGFPLGFFSRLSWIFFDLLRRSLHIASIFNFSLVLFCIHFSVPLPGKIEAAPVSLQAKVAFKGARDKGTKKTLQSIFESYVAALLFFFQICFSHLSTLILLGRPGGRDRNRGSWIEYESECFRPKWRASRAGKSRIMIGLSSTLNKRLFLSRTLLWALIQEIAPLRRQAPRHLP